MNKKIFTLFAGILLLGLFATPGYAQFAKRQDLRVGNTVSKLKEGPNPGYYYLAVDSIVGGQETFGRLIAAQLTNAHKAIKDTVATGWGDGGAKNAYVLFMGQEKNGRHRLFIDTINVVKERITGTTKSYVLKEKWKGQFSDDTYIPNTEISASALWCVNVTKYNQGQNPTFDFTNKQHDALLEVDVYDRENWNRDTSSYLNGVNKNWIMSPSDTSLVPGGISGWEFSETYATVVNGKRPLVSYLDDTHDTVAVLCLARDTISGQLGRIVLDSFICVKIAPATDVRAHKVDGMILFSLREALPFALDAEDINSRFNTSWGSLTFNPDGSPNPFPGIKAEQLVGTSQIGYKGGSKRGTLVDISLLGTNLVNNHSWSEASRNDSVYVEFRDSTLDHMGYLRLINPSTGKYLYADTFYYEGNAGGHQFLKFAWGEMGKDIWKTIVPARPDSVSTQDSLMYGQYVWRLVYYPSGDSIYINPFKAAYRPTYDPRLWNNGADSVLATGVVTQQRYTFAAIPDTTVMRVQHSVKKDGTLLAPTKFWYMNGPITKNPPLNYNEIRDSAKLLISEIDTNHLKTARLRDGYMWAANSRGYKIGTSGTSAPQPYKYRHRLYVSVQNLAGGRVTTLHSNHSGELPYGELPYGDHSINTQINYGVYTPCSPLNSDRATIPTDLYLIRNTEGQYLHVPLYSAHDSAVWKYLEPGEHPEELPSFQWIVEQRYTGAEASPVNIINREFGHKNKKGRYGLAFENVQLRSGDPKPFKFRVNLWRWNTKKVNSNVVKFEDVKNMSETNGATFIALPKKYKNNPLLGYQWIDPDTSIVSLYAFNYVTQVLKPGDDRYIATGENFDMSTYPNLKDTFLYIGKSGNWDAAYFRLDTIGADYGSLAEYGYRVDTIRKRKNMVPDLVTLKRQPYRLTLENPFKYCLGTLNFANGREHYYTLSSKLNMNYSAILGHPAFYLRDVYMEDNGTKDFALVQIADTGVLHKKSDEVIETYIKEVLGDEIAGKMMTNLHIAGEFNPGLFVVEVEDATAKLKYGYRGDAQTRVSTFNLKRDDDPIYRRFNSDLEGTVGDDSPRTMKFFTVSSMPIGKNYLYENTGMFWDQKNYYRGPRNYLGLASSSTHLDTIKSSIFVDTAYVRRGTGYIKPQYMLVIRPQIIKDTVGCDDAGNLTVPIKGYIRGMYLINSTDSAAKEALEVSHPRYNTYLWDNWERFVFTDAIHANDALYIIGGVDLSSVYVNVDKKGALRMIDLKKLDAISDTTSAAPDKAKGKIRKIRLDNNYHKDCVFQFRLVERGSAQKDFFIESETKDRGKQPMIAPCEGGWMKIQNGVPVISRGDIVKKIVEAERFNVEMTSEAPVANEVVPTTSGVKVVAENGSVTVLNASGKRVVISNVLGQTVVNTVLSSDRATVAAPKGVVLVAVEGEPVVKALVK